MRDSIVMLVAVVSATMPVFAQTDVDTGEASGSDAAAAAPVDAGSRRGLLPIPNYLAGPPVSRYLTGDWSGTRTDLASRGIQFDLSLTQTLQGVVDGGVDQGWRYGGKLVSHTNFDLDRMDVIPGGLLLVTTESRYGRSVNDSAGTILPVNDVMFFPLTDEPDEDLLIAITELRYTQFLSEEVQLFVGKFIPLGGDVNEFVGGRGDTQFMSHTFLSASVTTLINPYSTLGAGVVITPVKNLTFGFNVYQSADSSTTSGFENFGDGWTMDASVRYQYRHGDLPGGFRMAFEYAFDGNFVDFTDRFVDPGAGLRIPRKSDSWNVYANLWQYLHVEDPSDKPINVGNGRVDRQGVGVFLRAGIADQDTNPLEWIVSGGIAGRGIIPGRDNDTFGIGYGYSRVREVRFVTGSIIADATNRFEAFYKLAITPAAELTFDLQVADPIFERHDTAVILGARLRLQF